MVITLYQNEQMQWCRKCSCGREIIYANKRAADSAAHYLRHSEKNTCHSCRQTGENNRRFGKPISEKNRIAISIRNKGNTYSVGHKNSDEFKKEMSVRMRGNKYTLGYKHSDETRAKLKNKIVSDDTREKLRKHRWEQISKLGIKMANYNPRACSFMDQLNIILGLNLRHALNGGEKKISWYSVDGYDENNGVVFEYDEKYHNSPSYQKNDLIRQKRIVGKVRPSLFLRYDEQHNRLYDTETNSTIPILCPYPM